MAELVASLVIDNLVPLLKEEVNLLREVHREFESIKNELDIIKPYLKDADEKAEREESNDGVKALVKQIRKVSYRIEDVVDEYILHVHVPSNQRRRGLIGGLYKVARSIIKCKPQHKIGSEIRDIKATISEIHQLRNTYDLKVTDQEGSSSSSKSTWHDPRVASLFLDEAQVVGIDSARAELKIWMAKEASSKRRVISVVGEGGLGKTTLVKKVFDDQIASGDFDCHAWLTVSESNKIEDLQIEKLLIAILKQFHNPNKESPPPCEIETMDEASLIRLLREYLQEKRYVVVFDDVWDFRFWEFIKPALPNDNKLGSRVIITTRDNRVAKAACIESKFDKIYKLNHLSHNKAMELFCKNAFQSNDGGICPPELEEVCDEIVRKCNGVPLAIATIGRLCLLLSTEENVVIEWQKFRDRFGSELKSNPQLRDVNKIILFSYQALPYHLKLCFLFFGIFPEDYPVECGRLVRLWIAEGFVKEERDKTLEETAEEYLKELIHRSLVQVKKVRLNGQVIRCGVHDIMREIIISKYEELSFCQLLLAKDDPSFVDENFRRLSIYSEIDDVINNIIESRIRSVFTIGIHNSAEALLGRFVANFKLLKVLDFKNARALKSLPNEVGNLLHLRYLSLRNTRVKVLPKSIGRLRYLLTLDLKESLVDVLPIEIKWLHRLRHLLASCPNHESEVKFAPYYSPPRYLPPPPPLQNFCPLPPPPPPPPLPNFSPLPPPPLPNFSPLPPPPPPPLPNFSPLPPPPPLPNSEDTRGVKIQQGFGFLKDLQELKFVEANDDGGSLVKELLKLRQLRKLGIINLKKGGGKDMCIAVGNMIHLVSLHVKAAQNDILDLQHISSPPNSLQRLVLNGRLEKFPDWISKLQNVVRIHLCDSRLTQDPLKFLQTLRSLLELGLYNAYDGEVLHFEAPGFHNLKRLELENLTKLVSVQLDTEALPLLEAAVIEGCRSLVEVPAKIGNVRESAGLGWDYFFSLDSLP